MFNSTSENQPCEISQCEWHQVLVRTATSWGVCGINFWWDLPHLCVHVVSIFGETCLIYQYLVTTATSLCLWHQFLLWIATSLRVSLHFLWDLLHLCVCVVSFLVRHDGHISYICKQCFLISSICISYVTELLTPRGSKPDLPVQTTFSNMLKS